MTKRAGRPGRPAVVGGLLQRIPGPVVALLSAVLTTLAAVALNAATGNPADLPAFPAPLRPIQQSPWAALLVLTAAGGLLAWAQASRTAAPTVAASAPTGLLPDRGNVGTLAEQANVRRQLLDQVRRTWVEGVLDRSLAQIAHIELGLVGRPDAIAHPWGGLLHRPNQPDEPLPPGTPIIQITDRLGQHLLILGGPGAGKTTLLLEYAADLLQQADRDAAAPIPVVFHLSAWPAEEPPVEGWLVQELALRYGVSRRLAVELVGHDLLAVLLDGLDEVPEVRRGACVAAINAFRVEHGGVPLVVCTRSREYRALAAQLTFNGAVEVQPLARGQVQEWLAAAGQSLAGLRTALRDADHWLWELLDRPLLLSIAALTYKDQPASAVRGQGSVEALLGAYVAAMLARPRAPLAAQQDSVAYADADTLRWLGWLAERMGEESMFHPDWMQPDWLPTRRQRWLATTGLGLAAALTGGLAVGLVAALGLGLASRPGVGLAGELGLGLAGGLASGLGMGLTRRGSRIRPIEPTQWSWSTARHELVAGLGVGLVVGLVSGLVVGLFGGLGLGLSLGLAGGLVATAAVVLTGGFESRPNVRPAAPLEGIRAAARVGRSSGAIGGLVIALGLGLGGGLGGAVSLGLAGGLGVGLRVGLGVGLALGLAGGLGVGLSLGGASYLRHRLLVMLLQRQGLLPADLVGFLGYVDSRILMRRAGGGYLFIHRLLQDHFVARATHDRPRTSPNRIEIGRHANG